MAARTRRIRLWPVVLLAVVLAGCGHDVASSPRHMPAASTPPSSPGAAGTVDDFPLAQGLATDADTQVTAPTHYSRGVVLPSACWGQAWPGATVDRLVVQQVGPESAVTRELALYPDVATAVAVAGQVRTRTVRCRWLAAASGQAAMDVTLFRDSTTEFAPAVARFAETIAGGRPGGAVFVFTRVGRAILAVEDGGEWTRQSAAAGARDLDRADRALVARLCMFSDAGC